MFRLLSLTCLLLPLVTSTGCKNAAAQTPGKDGPPPAMPVSVSVPIYKEIPNYDYFTGRIEAVQKVEIRSRVTGYLQEIHFKEGAEVKKDELLFTIDDKLYQAELAGAKGTLAQAEAKLKRANAEVNRVNEIKNTVGAISQSEVDKIFADKSESEALVQIAKATLDRTENNLSYTKILAPHDGRISRFQLTKGNLVSADTTVLADIVTVDPVHIYFDVDEQTILRIQTMIRDGKFESARRSDNVKIHMALGNEQGFPHEGTIDFVDNKIDPRIGSMWIRGKFTNPVVSNNDRRFTPGMFVRVRLPLGPPRQAILVTDRAIGTDQGNKFVFVIEEGNMAGYRQVKLGPMYEGLRVVESGIQPTDKVVVNGILRVRPGADLSPKVIDMPTSAYDGKPGIGTEPDIKGPEKNTPAKK